VWSYAQSLRAIAANASLRRVILAYVLYNLIELTTWVAIILYAYQVGGVGLASLAAVVQLIPGGVLSPAIVGFVDRLPRGTALLLVHALVAATTILTTVLLLASAPVAVVIAGATLVTISMAVARPVHYATLPRLVRSPAQLVSANSVSSIAEALALFLGPILAGIGVEAFGAGVVFLVASLAGIASVLLTLRLDLGRTSVAEDEETEGWRDALGGVVALWRNWPALSLLLIMTIAFVFAGAIDVLGVSFADAVLGMGESQAGLLVGAVGIGGLVGGVVSGVLARRDRLSFVISGSGVLQGLALAGVALTALLWPAFATLALCGFAGTIVLVSGRTLLQRTTDDSVLAKVFAVQEGVSLLGLAVGAALAPVVVEAVGERYAFVPLGLGGAILVALVYVMLRRLDSRAVLRSREIEVLSRIGFLSALPPYEMERLARNAWWLDVDAGTEIIRQGDHGDLFYAIAEGEYSVTIDGERRPGLLGPGEGFGELALLRSAPRNATIRAVSGGRLLVVAGQDFLAVVTGDADGQALAEEIGQAHLERDRRHGG
jgi:predicted MFS family arabinose efflux permease